jgi:hypothetical protein
MRSYQRFPVDIFLGQQFEASACLEEAKRTWRLGPMRPGCGSPLRVIQISSNASTSRLTRSANKVDTSTSQRSSSGAQPHPFQLGRHSN